MRASTRSRWSKEARGVAFAAALVLLCACSARRSDRPLVAAPVVPAIPEGESFGTELVVETPSHSVFVSTLQGSLQPHYHEDHEETIYVTQGRARMRLGTTWHELHPGMLVHVPRGTVHAVETYETTTVLSYFSPAFDGKDRVYVDETAEPAE